jgi:hypothetical protein
MTMPAVFPDSIEILVFRTEAGPTLVAAIELISPGNKDRLEHRRAFAAKCSSYLQQGIGLGLIDIVINRQANLHNEAEPLYAMAYRLVRREDAAEIEVWSATLAVGRPLSLLPLDLGETYTEACERSRLP